MQQSSDVAETITHANGDAEDPRPAHSLRRHLDHVRVSSGRFAPETAVRYPTGPSNDWVKRTCAKREMLVDRRAPADRSRCDKRAFPSVRSHQSLPRPIRAS
jgi:hypothetical protein